MALADIVKRIDRDAQSEAAEILLAAENEAEATLEAASRKAERTFEERVEQARREAEEQASLVVASARLRGRDRLLAEKRVLIERVFTKARKELLALPDEEYAALIAREVAASARGGEKVALGTEDVDRLRPHLPSALEGLGCDVTVVDDPAPISHGAVLLGDRMLVEASIDSILAAERERYEALVAKGLFEEEG